MVAMRFFLVVVSVLVPSLVAEDLSDGPTRAEASATMYHNVQCGSSTTVGNCIYRSCSDPIRSINVSFSACQVQKGSSTVSVETYTNVTCPCSSGPGDITVRVELPNGRKSTYRDLNAIPDPDLLNATQCDNGTQDSQPYSYCIMFTDLTMVENINTTKLVSEVTDALVLLSSQACLIIEFPAPKLNTTTPTFPPTGASSGSPPKTTTLFLPLLGAYILVKLFGGSHFFTT